MPQRERTGVICLNRQHLLCIEQRDPITAKRFWGVPGGALEPGETPGEAAIRETLEETGYNVLLTTSNFVSEYVFRWNGQAFDCTTHWFGATLADPEAPPGLVDDADYILQTKWLPWPRCQSLFEYHPAVSHAIGHIIG